MLTTLFTLAVEKENEISPKSYSRTKKRMINDAFGDDYGIEDLLFRLKLQWRAVEKLLDSCENGGTIRFNMAARESFAMLAALSDRISKTIKEKEKGIRADRKQKRRAYALKKLGMTEEEFKERKVK